ncbi:PP2C family protein-serine/threonine phosphatase [Flagellimonas meridianipacifica]|uniref:Protein phosphatase n=1 Tax=Flagellimonas meridianipacifica TaxID=1080225 RepID=A0A2T0MFA5_9FLAO|nr:protein phosphatase 2C domain-containing protein [Allomuricauda pacifica]PRX56261.1 protein phosphatase [Allomuricauda pacifica]
MKSIAFSYKGNRGTNQDVIWESSLSSGTNLYLIADGMGGYDNGKLAASMIVESISTFLSTVDEINEESIQKAVNKANLVIRQFQELNQSKLGATVGGVIVENNIARCFWIGDIKILKYSESKLDFESKSHNLFNETLDDVTPNISEIKSKYSHVVTRSVQGNAKKSIVSYDELELNYKTDKLIICSDGLHNIIDSHSIEYLLNSCKSLDEVIEKIRRRLKMEAEDNASFIFLSMK